MPDGSQKIELQHIKVEKNFDSEELKKSIPLPRNMEELELLRSWLEETYGKNSAFYFTYRLIPDEPNEKPKTNTPA